MRLSSRMEAKQCLLLPRPKTTLALVTAAMARSASARVSASGFSHHTGLPAAATALIWSTCSECGVARTTACTRGSATTSENSVPSSKPWVLAKIGNELGLFAHAANKAQALALALHRFDDGFAPASQPDDGGVDHRAARWVGCRMARIAHSSHARNAASSCRDRLL